jgi:hypothetical protein
VLAALTLALHHDVGGDVSHANRRIGAIHVLATGARRAEGVDADVLRAYVDLDFVVDLRVNEDDANEVCRRALASKGEMRTRRCTPTFALQHPVGVLAVDLKGD